MLLTLVLLLVGGSTIAFGAELAGVEVSGDDPPPGVVIGGTLVQDLALIFSALLLAWLTAGRPLPAHFGLRRTRLLPAAGWLIAAWFAFLVFQAVWATLIGITENDDLPQELGADDSTTALVAVAVLVCVVAPIAEEFFFRGFCFTALRRWIGLIPGAIATGAIFGLIHAGGTDVVFLLPLAFFGVVLCLLYHRTGSLLPCIVLHAFNNALALGVTQEWPPLGVVALMAGAAATVTAIALPFSRSPGAGPPAPSPARA
jgi:membrane protease YdiL (CAAX protease family)